MRDLRRWIAVLGVLAVSQAALAQEVSRPPRLNVLTLDLPGTVGWFAISALNQLTILIATADYERALTPNLGLYGQIVPAYLITGLGRGFNLGVHGGLRYYFFGDAPAGLHATAGLGTGLPLFRGTTAQLAAILGVGYTWILDNGFTFGARATVNPLALDAGILAGALTLPIGFAF